MTLKLCRRDLLCSLVIGSAGLAVAACVPQVAGQAVIVEKSVEKVAEKGVSMKANDRTEQAVKAMLDKFAETYAERDMEGVLSTFLPGDDVFLFGTGADEKCAGRSEIEALFTRDWAQTEAASTSWEWISVSAAGPVAWVAAEVIFHVKVDGQAFDAPARLTTVHEKRGDQWPMAQLHVSFPAAGQEEGEAWPTE